MNTRAPKPSIIFAGNCNAGLARNALGQLGIVTDSADLYYVPRSPPELWNTEMQMAVRNCAVCFLQVRKDTKVFNDWLTSHLPASCKIIRYPAAFLLSFWPFVIDDPRNPPAVRPTLSEGPYPRAVTNRLLLAFLVNGDSPETAAARFLDLDVSKFEDFDRVHVLSLSILRSIEKDSDFVISDFIERSFQRERLFQVSLHPTGVLLAELTRMMIEAIGVKPSVAVDALLQRMRAFPGVGAYDAPVHPAIAAHFKVTWADGLLYRHFAEGSFTHDEYVRRYARFDYTPDHYEGLRLMDEGRPREAAGFLERAVNQNPGSPQFHLSLCEALSNLHEPARLAAVARRALEIFPNDGALWLWRAKACFEIDDDVSALAASEQAIAFGADPTKAWQLRAWLLGRNGRREEADAAARTHSWLRSQDPPPRPLIEATGVEYGRNWLGYGQYGF